MKNAIKYMFLGVMGVGMVVGVVVTTQPVYAAGEVFIDANVNGTLDLGELSFGTIQDAVNAASAGDTVNIAAGAYDEQIILNKSITLQGAGDATILQPSQTTASSFQLFNRASGGPANTTGIIVTDISGGTINIKNIKIDGSLISSTPSGSRFVGILYRNSANGLIDSVTVSGIGISESSAILLSGYGAPVSVEVSSSTISGYRKNGITANNAGMTVNIHHNTITGMGPTTLTAQNGVQIGFGASGAIHDNLISGNVWTGTYGGSNDPQTDIEADGATGILLYMPGTAAVEIRDNVLGGNQFGIWGVAVPNVNIHGNIITGLAHTGSAFPSGIALWTADMWTDDFGGSEAATVATVEGNVITDNDYGVLVRDYSVGSASPSVTLHENSLSSNTLLNLVADSATNAEENWWGTASSTEIDATIGGSGLVAFDPWYSDPERTILASANAPATLHVIKLVANGSSGTASPSDFTMHVKRSGTDVSGSPSLGTSSLGTPYSLIAGTYIVSEDVNTSYTSIFSGDCDANGSVTLVTGDDKICTILNTDIPIPIPTSTPSGSSAGGSTVAPLINIVKIPSPLTLPSGPGPVTYTYTVTNLSVVPMSEVAVQDNDCISVALISGDDDADSFLDAEESWIYKCTKTITQTIMNTAVARGRGNGFVVYDTAVATVVVSVPGLPDTGIIVAPLINVVKKPDVFILPAGGGAVTYTYTVTNPGTEPLSGVAVADDKCTGLLRNGVGIPGDLNENDLLESGETWMFTCRMNLTETTTNIATVRGSANGLIAVDVSLTTVVVATTSDSSATSTSPLSSESVVFVNSSTLNVRESASLKGAIVGQASSQTQGTLLSSPVQSDGYTWVEVQYQGNLTGWSVTAGLSESRGLKVGDRVVTIREMNVRSGAGIHEDIIRFHRGGILGTILGGPIQKDGYRWWQIRYDTNVAGWTADIGLRGQ